jgi:death-on-curing protein
VTRFIGLDEVLELHRLLLEQSGGMAGLRDLALLESAVAQPLMTFGGQELYPTIADKACAICYSLVMNHPFIDGNKRIGHAVLETFMVLNGKELDCSVTEQEKQILGLAAGNLKREEFTAWVQAHIVPVGGCQESPAANTSLESDESSMLTECPDFLGGGRVVCYTPIDSRHRYTGKTKHFVGGNLQGPAAGLAICQYEESGGHYFLLFGCNEHWEQLTDTWHKTLEDAIHQAELEYEGVDETWRNKN